jgi:DNA invertase Pin-like site-specific DNA recombinase
MNIAAYCRVSTEQQDQLNSLEAQKNFFIEYAQKNGYNLVRLYADEGISGTKIKKRDEFLQLMRDAKRGMFDMVVVKDISRFARNTVDLLQSVRTLKSLGIETTFLTTNMTVLGQSEFILTIFAALAQEESANTSKRIKFGKAISAKKGIVPNSVYGYDKITGDSYNLCINEREAKVVKQIFEWYTEAGYGMHKIADMLTEQGVRTKRNRYEWNLSTVRYILNNEIYIGRIINGKQEVEDFLTSKRKQRDKSDWYVIEKPELKIIEPEQFEKAQKIIFERHKEMTFNKKRHSNKHLFNSLIRCKECGCTFRRITRTYRRTYSNWICTRHNQRASMCPNGVKVNEDEMVAALEDYFSTILQEKNNVIKQITNEVKKLYQDKESEEYVKELQNRLNKVKTTREKYMDMYVDNLISREELNVKTATMKNEIASLESEIRFMKRDNQSSIEETIKNMFTKVEDITSVRDMTNEQLKQIIEKIEVDKEGNVDIFLRLFNEIDEYSISLSLP